MLDQNNDFRALSAAVEQIVYKGPPRQAIAELTRMRPQLSATEAALVDLSIAQLLFTLGESTEAAQAAKRAEDVAETLDTTSELAIRLQAALLVVRGVMCAMTDPQAAIDMCIRARTLYKALEDPWKMGGVECNLSIALAYQGRASEALDQLEAAELHSNSAAPTPALLASRLRAIQVNRAALLSMLQQDKDYLSASISARSAAVDAGDHPNIGRIDLNLAAYYHSRQQFGSALRAANSSTQAYLKSGLMMDAIAAKIQATRALISLGRFDGIEEFLTGLISKFEHEAGARPLWWESAHDAFAEFHRALNPEVSANMRTDLSPLIRRTPAGSAMAHIQTILDDVLEAIARGDSTSSTPDLTKQTDRLRGYGIWWAPAIADILERMIVAIHAGNDLPPLSDEHHSVLRLIGNNPDTLQDLVRSVQLVQSYDARKHLKILLGEIADHQIILAKQESEYDRSSLHDRAIQSLNHALQISLTLEERETTFEVLEAGRRDLSEWSGGFEALSALPFGELVTASGQDGPTWESAPADALRTPDFMSVKGRSALSGVRPRRKPGGEADFIRRKLGGHEATWLSMRIVDRHVVWAWLTEDRIETGSRRVDASFMAAWRSHSLALPLVMREHLQIAGPDAPLWAVEIVATAIAAAGPLIAQPELVSECLDALPGYIAKRTAEAISQYANPLHIYKDIADTVIPDPVRHWLDHGTEGNRLLVSVPAELATLPFPILEIGDGNWLGESAVVAFTPPSNLATQIASRVRRETPLHGVVTISNPTDDLKSAGVATYDPQGLTGWSLAPNIEHVASHANVFRRFRELGEYGDYGLSYVGHIRAGSKSKPGLSALVLSASTPEGNPTFVDSRSLIGNQFVAPRDVYLGGCESTGFGTGLEWASIAGAFLASGSDLVLAHAWPILDSRHAARVDKNLTEMLVSKQVGFHEILDLQRHWIHEWKRSPETAVPAHHWAGLNFVGRLR
ncbi:CHAT domain-containing protein [Kocuria sp. CPCC 205258]|uniref:CHAT domain-containing protein n=1 Tax=Kocuria sp. CPCC 205258 TaxID=3073552 RepID=UPI0034D65C84